MKCGDFGFEEMVYEMPPRSVGVDLLVRQAGYGDDMVARLHDGGLRRVPVGDGRPLYELVKGALASLVTSVPTLAQRTYGVLFAHSVPLLAPADVPFLALCLDGLHFEAVLRIAVAGQPCAILHMAVQLAGSWLGEAPLDYGILVVGADQAYSASERIFFGSAMGDVAFAAFLSRRALRNRVLASVSECEVIATGGEASPAPDIARFRSLNPHLSHNP
jgi:hypothetical protein